MEAEKQNIQYNMPLSHGIEHGNFAEIFMLDGLGFKVLNTWTPRGKIEWCWLQTRRRPGDAAGV